MADIKQAAQSEEEMTLKPCPFCGHEAMWAASTEDDDWEIQCQNQECRLILFGGGRTGREVAADWNRRIAEDVPRELNTEMLEALKDTKEFIEDLQLPDDEWSSILDRIVAIIAKAEGRS